MPADVLVIGATGMLGRPVTRRLQREGLSIRALVRNIPRARSMLPCDCEMVPGDLRERETLEQAMRGVESVYLNLSVPMRRRPPPFDPECDGTRMVVDAARRAGLRRIMRVSAMGVDDAADGWWPARHKAQADASVMESDLAWTIFRPTWLMESLATMVIGRRIISFDLGDAPLRWIAGDDLGRQVAAALRSPEAVERIYHPQGPELLTIGQAVDRFAAALPKPMRRMNLPLGLLRVGGVLNGRMHYLARLLEMTADHFARIDREVLPSDLPPAEMRIEDYVAYVGETGDMPSK